MYCKHCGTELTENVQFCTACGTPVSNGAAVQTPVTAPVSDEKRKDELATKALTYGILSVVFACYGVIVSFLGITFGIKAKAYAAQYKEEFGTLMGRPAVGRGLGIGGFIAGIFFTAFWALYLFFFIVIIIAGAAGA